MPLSDDQKAMLRLLARDQSYDDIAALMGLSVDEVVARAKGAVQELEAEGIPAPALPEAPGGAGAEPPAAPEAKPPTPVEAKPSTGPEGTAPEPAKPVETPETPPAQPAAAVASSSPAASAAPAASSAKPAAPKPPSDRRGLLTIGGAALAAIVIVVLLVVVLSGGDDGGDGTSASGDGTNVTASTGKGTPTTAELVAVDGSDASGEATFGRFEDSLGLGIKAEGLEQAPRGSIYMVWLTRDADKMLPLTAVLVNKAGRINASYEVPTEAVIYLASGEFDNLVITLSRNRDLRDSLVKANKDKDFPTYTGEPVLEGKVVGPIIGAAKRLEERQKENQAGK